MQIEDALDAFVRQLEADGRSDHTIGQYQRHVRLFSRWLGDRDLGEVEHEDVARFLSSDVVRGKRGGGARRPSSANAVRTSMRVFLGFAHDAGYAQSNPARLVRRARCGAPPPRALSDAEERRLVEVLEKGTDRAALRDRILFLIMLRTGIRLGSALGLDVGDVDLEQGELVLRQMKNNREDRVFLPRAIREDLRAWIGDRRSGPLFESYPGRRLGGRQARRRFELILEAAGIDRVSGTHCLRHSFATSLYRKTSDLLLVQSALRHASICSTTVYARASTDKLRRALGA